MTLKYVLKQFDLPAAVRWIALTIWMAVFLTYLLQSEGTPILSTGIPPGPPSLAREAFFTTIHLIAYTMTTMLWTWALITVMPVRRALIVTFVIVFAMGFLTELAQTLTPDRHFQMIDLAANMGGLMLGLVGFGFLYRWYSEQPV